MQQKDIYLKIKDPSDPNDKKFRTFYPDKSFQKNIGSNVKKKKKKLPDMWVNKSLNANLKLNYRVSGDGSH